FAHGDRTGAGGGRAGRAGAGGAAAAGERAGEHGEEQDSSESFHGIIAPHDYRRDRRGRDTPASRSGPMADRGLRIAVDFKDAEQAGDLQDLLDLRAGYDQAQRRPLLGSALQADDERAQADTVDV